MASRPQETTGVLAHVDPDEVTALTAGLVRLDTRNPPGNERPAADLCRQVLEPFGATFREVEPAPERTSLLATIGHPGDGRPTLIVNGHLDVVPINESQWTRSPFGAEIDAGEGRMYGRGTADMKGGIAAAICALSTLQRAGREPACNVVVHLVADEERGGALGTGTMAAQGLIDGDACLVPEPTGMQLCIAERGLMVATVTTKGTPAHGSQPQNGLSAVEKAAKIVLALHAADMGDADHSLLGTPTVNVGVIEGGSGHNTVPESCRIIIDRRLLPGMSRAEAEAGIQQKIAAIGDTDIHYDFDVTMFGEASELDPGHPLVATVAEAVARSTGHTPGVIGMSFTTDARFVRNQGGIPTIVFGPGDVDQAHTNDEWVAVDRLVEATAAYAELYAGFTVAPPRIFG
jgi:acetylornithine deacetylase/succinyl-diaminopimelate desuccinylase family protein